jgi:uncharacterized protein (TIGR02186 family)
MGMHRIIWGMALLASGLSLSSASAQTDMSFLIEPHTVPITLSFDGHDVLVFGVIPHTADGVLLTCQSSETPPITVVRKERVVFFWMATKKFRIEHMPGLYMLASSAPLNELLGEQGESVALAHGVGYAALRDGWGVERLSGTEAADDHDVLFDGLISLKEKEGLYRVHEARVRLEPDGLFFHRFRVPDAVTVGRQTVTAYALKDGQVMRTFGGSLEVEQAGAVKWLAELAHDHSALYGIVAVVVAMGAGLGVSKLFGGRGGH